MFWKIFFFEFQYRLRQPAVYAYCALTFIFTFLTFGLGALPLADKELINGPASLSFFIAAMSMMMMLVNSSIMGIPLHRDIEYNTREYYLSYPISKAGYFWGRYLASFIMVIAINAAVLPGAWLGSMAGKAWGWEPASAYGPNHLHFYLQPFLSIALPNLFFSASLFFGLVAITRNIKVIYCSGIFLFLGYMIANFLMKSNGSINLIYLSDPFLVNAVNYEKGLMTLDQKNTQTIPLRGLFLTNRIIWIGVSVSVLLITYFRFSFQRVFRNRSGGMALAPAERLSSTLPETKIDFSNYYNKRILLTLIKIELLNISRDAYFWMITLGGGIFIAFIFSQGHGAFWVGDYPRTSMILFLINQGLLLFIFCIIVFYAGELVHREKDTRYSIINDALPPSTFILNVSKFTSLCVLTLFLTFAPMVIGLSVQLAMGFPYLNIPLYFTTLLGATLPKCLEMAMLAFTLHIIINRKFVALGVAIALWVLFNLANDSGWMNYHLLLYSFTPFYALSDLDGIDQVLKPVSFFNIYWSLFGGLLLVLAYLFYARGVLSGIKDRVQLAVERWKTTPIWIPLGLLSLFIISTGFNYYNVSVVNHYYTTRERDLHAAILEKRLKLWEDVPAPSIKRIVLNADLYPSRHRADFNAFVTLLNSGREPIDSILLDGDNLSGYTISLKNHPLTFSCPVLFKRGKFNLLGPSFDSSSYRIYYFPQPLNPGDSAVLVVNSYIAYEEFANDLYGVELLRNGIFSGPGLPGLGYDDDEELENEGKREEFGLPKREEDFALSKEAEGRNKLWSGSTGIASFLITASTEEGQTVIAPGNSLASWKKNGRNFFQYGFDQPGAYGPLVLISARYEQLKESIRLADQRQVDLRIYFDPKGNLNIDRFMNALKDGIPYFAANFGDYPYNVMNLTEGSIYSPGVFFAPALESFSERYAWSTKFRNQGPADISYYAVNNQLARQWWCGMVSPSHTRGCGIIADGLPNYCALALAERKYGRENLRPIVKSQFEEYRWGRGWHVWKQRPLLQSSNWREVNPKTALVLMGLKDLVGEDCLNRALREFADSFAFRKSPPWAGAVDFFAILRKHVPDSLQYFLKDNFENVCMYDNSVVSVHSNELPNEGGYIVNVELKTSKEYQDSVGNSLPAPPMNDWIDIAIFGENENSKEMEHPKLLYLEKMKFREGMHALELRVKGKPASVEIDPFLRLIDLNRGDNSRPF